MRRPRLRLLVPCVLVGALAALLGAAWVAAPALDSIGARLAAREQATGVRHAVPLQRIAPVMLEAIVATEDERFYSNHGIDLLGIARATPYDIAHLSFAQGASTITDQLAKLLYLHGNDHSPWRKLEDLAISLRISTRYSKEQVLDAYLNTAYFGHGAYGIGIASERYFGVVPSRLSLAQASLLAGLVQAPTAYDPLLHPRDARQRQVVVLRSLVRDGYATSQQATRVLASPLALRDAAPLPPLKGVTVASQPAFAWGGLAVGSVMIAVALAGLGVTRRRSGHRHGVQVAVKIACTVVVVLGAVLLTDSFRVL